MQQLAQDDPRYLRDQGEIRDLVHRFVVEADKRSVEGMVGCCPTLPLSHSTVAPKLLR